MHVRTPSTSVQPPLRRPRVVLAIFAVLALLFTTIQVSVVRAAGAPPAGTYTGTSTAYTGATVELEIDAAGNLVEFDTESYLQCGFNTIPIQWAGIPATPVSADTAFDLEWSVGDDPDWQVEYYLKDVVIRSDGTATGQGHAYMPTCQGLTFTFNASLEGGGGDPDPDPEPGEPTVVLDPATLEEDEIRIIGTRVGVSGFPEDADVDFTVTRLRDNRLVHESTITTSSSGAADFAFRQNLSATLSGERFEFELSTVVDGVESTDTAQLVVYRQWEFNNVNEREMTVAPESVSVSELAASGVTFSSSGYRANKVAQLSINGQPAGEVMTDANGNVAADFTSTTLSAGEHEAMLISEHIDDNMQQTRHRDVAVGTFTVTEDPAPVYDPSVSVSPQELTVSELAADGVTVTGEGFVPDSDVSFAVNGVAVGTDAADGAGAVSFSYTSSSLGAGSHVVELSSADGSDTATFTVAADPTPDPTVDPTPDPTVDPTPDPTVDPTPDPDPTVDPTPDPTVDPTPDPTVDPTPDPTVDPTPDPTVDPTPDPTVDPTPDPTVDPTPDPTVDPTPDPTVDPTPDPTVNPTPDPTVDPTPDPDPTVDPTPDPDPTVDPTPDPDPTVDPTPDPDPTQIPEVSPSEDELTADTEGGITVPPTVEQGEVIEVQISDVESGTDVGTWFFSEPVYLGTRTVTSDRSVAVTVPEEAAFGEHKLAVWSSDEVLVGWASVEVVDPNQEPDPGPDPTDDPTDQPTTDPSNDPTDDPTADPSLAIAPDVIGVSDFVDADKGVRLSVDSLEEGATVEFDIAPSSGQDTEPATLSAQANAEGVATVSVYGVDAASASSYIGEYQVTAHADDEDESLNGSFRVVADDDVPGGGDGGDGDNGSGSGDGSGDGDTLPRTGQSAAGVLAIGLLLAGVGLTLTLWSRRRTG